MGRLSGKVALITGAARGQGAIAAQMFVAEGASVMLADVLDDQGRAVAAGLQTAEYISLDVGDEAAWERAVAATIERFGRIDILINNAAIFRSASIESTTVEFFNEMTRVNQLGVLLGMKTVVPHMKKQGGGSIVNISSVAGLIGSGNLAAYTASKWAVRGMTKVAALELADFGIRVNSVHPGLIDTDMVRGGVGSTRTEMLTKGIPLARVGRVEEPPQLMLFLASDESSYCTGGEYVCDGGYTAGRPFVATN